MTREERRNLHAAINALTHAEVAQIVKREHPELNGEKLNAMARLAIAKAHGMVLAKESVAACRDHAQRPELVPNRDWFDQLIKAGHACNPIR